MKKLLGLLAVAALLTTQVSPYTLNVTNKSSKNVAVSAKNGNVSTKVVPGETRAILKINHVLRRVLASESKKSNAEFSITGGARTSVWNLIIPESGAKDATLTNASSTENTTATKK